MIGYGEGVAFGKGIYGVGERQLGIEAAGEENALHRTGAFFVGLQPE